MLNGMEGTTEMRLHQRCIEVSVSTVDVTMEVNLAVFAEGIANASTTNFHK